MSDRVAPVEVRNYGSADLAACRSFENEVSRLLLSGALQPDDRVRADYDDVELTFDVEKGAAEQIEEVEEPESEPAHV